MTLLDILPQKRQGTWAYFLVSPMSTCSAWIAYSDDMQGLIESDLLTPLDLADNGSLPPGVYLWQGVLPSDQDLFLFTAENPPQLVLNLGKVSALKDLN